MKLVFLLTGFFFVTAMLYASVGFGGGSTYTALLIATGTDFRLVPVIALTCNILVVSGNVWRYKNQGLIDLSKIWPLVIISIPAAWVGGRLEVSETLFIGLLWMALLFAGTRLLLAPEPKTIASHREPQSVIGNALIGGIIGFYAGLVGIGGGIFLAPVLHFLRWDTPRKVAAACSLFILVNSVSGISGQIAKLDNLSLLGNAVSYWPLIPAVIIGGFIGNHFGVFKFSSVTLKRVTGGLILVVAVRLAFRWFALI